MNPKYYILVENCFMGEVGDIIVVEDDGDSYWWHNRDKNIVGCPVAATEWDFLREIK